jgi:hypothetical protein
MQSTVAYLTNGQLFLHNGAAEPREVQSAFAQQVMERQARNNAVHGWRSQSGVWGAMGFMPPELAAWEQGQQQRTPVQFKSVTPGDEAGHLYYILGVGDMGGLFHYTAADNVERRLMHRNGFLARDLSRHTQSGSIAVAVYKEDGSSSIQVGENDGRFLKDVTIGDAIDECPAWVPGDGRRIVYQSAGIGRNEHGFAMGLAPYRIELIDLDKQSVDVVLEEEHHDLLQPKMLADGTLYFIRRPYEPLGPKPADPITVLKDIVLFPFRLARAVFHFLDFFSMMFSGKPLHTAGGPPSRVTDQKYLMVWGRMIDTKRAMQKSAKDKTTGLVPKEWQLIRRDTDGNETVLAEKVLSFDVHPDGTVIYTDGHVVNRCSPDGETTQLFRDQFIEKVTAVT